MQVYPNVHLPTVDVRDCAKAHIISAFSPKFKGRNDRLLMAAESLWYKEIIEALRSNQN